MITHLHIAHHDKYEDMMCIYIYSIYPVVNVYITMENHHPLKWVNKLFRLGHFPEGISRQSPIKSP